MTITDLPTFNASMNAISTVFISLGWWFIRRGFWRQHIACMITAIISSSFFSPATLFITCMPAKNRPGYTGLIAWFYFPLLISHVLLAFVTLPLVILTLVPVFAVAGKAIAGSRNGRCRSGFTFPSPGCWFI